MKKIMAIFGTRPEAIKMAPVIKELQRQTHWFETQVVVTGQHRELLTQVLDLFEITPDINLQIMRHNQSLTDMTSAVIRGLEPVFRHMDPDVVLVHGDTTTTFAASLAASYHQITVGHVEAGLRSNARFDPFPEEMNRRLTSVLAAFHFAPTVAAAKNLLREHVPAEDIFVTGNTVIDALQSMVEPDYRFQDPQLAALAEMAAERRIVLLTTHRRENWGRPMTRIFSAIMQIASAHPEVLVVFPVHKNPLIRKLAEEMLGGRDNIKLIDPPPYKDFANLMARCYLIVTDSGGLQEEGPALGKPVLVLRNTTERPEGVAAGTAELVGTEIATVAGRINRLLTDADVYRRMVESKNPYGDGGAAERVVAGLAYKLGLTQARPGDFGC